MADYLVLGGTGQVGAHLVALLGDRAVSPRRDEFDLLRPMNFVHLLEQHRPRIVINAAADTAVDRAETDARAAIRVNNRAPCRLAAVCRLTGARLIHFSTDYVFAGDKGSPYWEDDPTSPVNLYGKHKLYGEQGVLTSDPRHVVFRLSWVYDTRGRNFALTMLRLAAEGRPIRVVDDQIGSPTYARCIAEAAVEAADHLLLDPSAPGGLFHMSAAGQTSWHGFAVALLEEALGADAPSVEAIPSSAFPTPARRPAYSVLDNGKLAVRFGIRLPYWRDQLTQWAADRD